jgi:hypothetical protein
MQEALRGVALLIARNVVMRNVLPATYVNDCARFGQPHPPAEILGFQPLAWASSRRQQAPCHRDSASCYRAEMEGDEVGRVKHQHANAITGTNARPAQACGELADARRQLSIAQRFLGAPRGCVCADTGAMSARMKWLLALVGITLL